MESQDNTRAKNVQLNPVPGLRWRLLVKDEPPEDVLARLVLVAHQHEGEDLFIFAVRDRLALLEGEQVRNLDGGHPQRLPEVGVVLRLPKVKGRPAVQIRHASRLVAVDVIRLGSNSIENWLKLKCF